jgi:hypothetical protein
VVRLFVLIASVLLSVAAVAASGTAAPAPRLALDRLQPPTVTGTGFAARERVRLVLVRPSGSTGRRAKASAHGRFSKAFAGVTLDRCSAFSIRASGSAGSDVRLVHRAAPKCPPT